MNNPHRTPHPAHCEHCSGSGLEHLEPPTTGPATRSEKGWARFRVALDRDWFPLIVCLGLGGICVFMVHSILTAPPDPVWLIECPDRESWVSPRISIDEGRVMARDPNDQRVSLPSNCMATEVQPP